MRQQFMADYQNLKEHFLEVAKSRIVPSVLNTLKVTYSDVINSARCTDYIDSVEGLLRILEKRGALSYDNIEPLKHISSTFVNDPGLERALREYEARICRSSPLPLCNVYEMHAGKYVEGGPRSRLHGTLNRSDLPSSNSSESTNDHDINNCNSVSGVQRENESSSPEDQFVAETLVPYHSPTVRNRRDLANSSVYPAKVRKNICSKFGIPVMGALLGVGLVTMFITIGNLLYVPSSVSGLGRVDEPGVSGVETVFNSSQLSEMQARMTVYTTPPAFRLALPGSLFLSPTTSQRPVPSDSDEARMGE